MTRVTVAPHTPALAADFNAVADQVIMRFPTAAARTAAIPTPTEGMHTYRDDANIMEFWNGAAWEARPRITRGKFNASTDGGGNAVIAHGLGVNPAAVVTSLTTVGSSAVEQVAKIILTSSDTTNFAVFVRRSDSGAALAGPIAFDWIAIA